MFWNFTWMCHDVSLLSSPMLCTQSALSIWKRKSALHGCVCVYVCKSALKGCVCVCAHKSALQVCVCVSVCVCVCVLGRLFQMLTFSQSSCFQACNPLLGEGNGNPLQCSCLENPRDGRAWWAAVYRVTQSQTRLKRLSSSSSSNPLLTSLVSATLSPDSLSELQWRISPFSLRFSFCVCLSCDLFSFSLSVLFLFLSSRNGSHYYVYYYLSYSLCHYEFIYFWSLYYNFESLERDSN